MMTEDIFMDGENNNTIVSNNDIKPTENFVGILGKKRKERKFDRSLLGLLSEKSVDVEG